MTEFDATASAEAFATHPDWADAGGWAEVAHTADPNDELFGHVVEEVSIDGAETKATEQTTSTEQATSKPEYEALLVGEPFDGAVIGRPGASEGPIAIRKALARTKTHHFDSGRIASVGDLGDVAELLEVEAGDVGETTTVAEIQNRLLDTTAAVHDLDALPIFVGGDNSLTYPNVAPLLERASVGVINLDAHLDVREVRDDPTSGTPYRQLLEAGLDGYVCLGARHFETSGAYHEYVHERGGEVVTAEEVGEDPVEAVDVALNSLGPVDHVYVSVDCDVLEASAAPGVSAPTPGGITTRELFRTLRLLASDDRIAGFEVVECAPPLDRTGLTATAAGRAIAHFLAGYLEGRR